MQSPNAPLVSDEHDIRLQKVTRLRAQGIEPWPAACPVSNTTAQVKQEYEADYAKEYTLAGRVMSIRLHGKTAFVVMQDESGRVQLYLKQEVLGESFEFFKDFIDLGDMVWAHGKSFKTKTGEVTVSVSAFTLLSKSLHPLPEKFHGLTDIETKYRQRYLDIITNPESKERFVRRTKLLRSVRSFLDSHGYMEVETPMLHPIAGGAAARPFITHHNALSSDFYLRIAPELYLKRLVVAGFERVYEINRNFRNEGISTRHNPEFTMLEFYTAHHDYHYIMNFVENMLKSMIQESTGQLQVPFGEHVIDFSAPFKRINVTQAIIEHSDLTLADLGIDVIDMTLKRLRIEPPHADVSFGQKLFLIFEEVAEKKLIQPTYLIDYPIEISPLAKQDSQNPGVAARFELFIAGMEIANGFNELNDPLDQAERFKEQLKAYEAGDKEAHQYDQDFITALEYGLPPTVGVGVGIDRLTMLATNTTSIKDVILFPTLKKK